MDSTPTPIPTPTHVQTLSIKASARKLPVKRKTPDSSSSNPNPNSSPILTPKIESTTADEAAAQHGVDDDEDDDDDTAGGDRKPPPFKFHRIWTEPDEIRFLQGLLDCSTEGLSFPRDLNVFYSRFSDTMSQPYTKSQLSEKLRRLRKKFRVISSRLAKGLDKALLSPHDRALYDLSKQLWHPDYSSTSPFCASSNKPKKSNLVGVKVSFSPTLPPAPASALAPVSVSNQTMIHELKENSVLNCVDNDNDGFGVDIDGDVKLSEVNVEFEDGVQEEDMPVRSGLGGGIGQVAAKTAIDVFDQSLKEVRMNLVRQGFLFPDNGSKSAGSSNEGKVENFEKRWREQCVEELDVLARRLRLVLEHSLQRQ